MKEIRWVPGAVGALTNMNIPATAPDIDTVLAAEITRIPSAFVVAHGASVTPVAHGDGVAVTHANLAVAAHAAHAHDLISQGTTIPPVVPIGWDAIPPTQLEDTGAAALHTWAGGGATGIQDQAIPAHVVTQPDDHAPADVVAGLADHAGADIAVALINHAASGGTVAVAAVPTRQTTRIIQLDVPTQVGDLLTLFYLEVGERVLIS